MSILSKAHSQRMNFDRIARHYRWMEWLFAAGMLQRCRTRFVSEIREPNEVLLVGDGNGRCLEVLLRAYPLARYTFVDLSGEMIKLARKRLEDAKLPMGRLQFIHADALTWEVPEEKYDLLVTGFFFDCFTPQEVELLVKRLASGAGTRAQWLAADFHEPATGLEKWFARILLGVLYAFFKQTAGVKAEKLTPPDEWLVKEGFSLRKSERLCGGVLKSDWWERIPKADVSTF